MIEVRDVHKAYGPVEVLRGVSLDVDRGEVVSMIGGSGSGKSTLLMCINGLEPIQKGAVLVDGTDVHARGTDLNRLRRKIGIVFQQWNAFPHLTVLENVMLAPRKVLGLSAEAARERAQNMLDLVGLPDKADSYSSQLSGGQQQRVGIARALALEPKIILMDEPTSALDPELVGSVLDVVRDLRSQGMTMVIASHEMGFARKAADRVLFLDGGLVVEEGKAEEVFGAPRESRTQRFLAQVRH